MQKIIYDTWNIVMNHNKNPLKNIPDTNVRHMIMQVLAWMWCIVFSMYMGSIFIMGLTMIAHVIFIAAIVVTVATFETAKKKPSFFLRLEKGTNGYHTPTRARYLYHDGKRIPLDPNDPGGEHE